MLTYLIGQGLSTLRQFFFYKKKKEARSKRSDMEENMCGNWGIYRIFMYIITTDVGFFFIFFWYINFTSEDFNCQLFIFSFQ